jgi:hypothetical protein
MRELPSEIKNMFGQYGPVVYDGYCGEPVGWGHRPSRYLEKTEFEQAGKHGEWMYISDVWYLVTKKITKEEALEKYGPVNKLQTGPRGGFRAVNYGDTTFWSKELDPRK